MSTTATAASPLSPPSSSASPPSPGPSSSSGHLSRVLESALFISQRSTRVSIPPAGVCSAAAKLLQEHKKGSFSLKNWSLNPLNPTHRDEDMVMWIFLIDTLNFSFWLPKGKTAPVYFEGKQYNGYWSLCAAVNRAISEGVPMTSPQYLAGVTLKEVQHIFRAGDTSGASISDASIIVEVPLLEDRVKVMNELGKVLLDSYEGSAVKLLKEAGQSALSLVELIMAKFSSYRDVHQYAGREVYIAKRAQILVADLWAAFEGKSYGTFHDIDQVTMFADYRVPQTLLFMGLLEYDDETISLLQSGELLESGSELEVEIRGCSIWSVELVRREMVRLLKETGTNNSEKTPLNAVVLDFYLWDYAKAFPQLMEHLPIHHTRSIYY